MTDIEPQSFPFSRHEKLDLDPLYPTLRREKPLLWVQLPFGEPVWLATRHEDVKVVLGDPRFSRAAATDHDEPRVRFHQDRQGIMSFDPPEHTRLRRLVAKAFTVKRVERLRPYAQRVADGLVDAMLAKGAPVDLVEDFAILMPVTVICELLGVPFEDRTDFRIWSEAIMSTTRFAPEQVADYVGRLRGYMAGLITQRRETARDDLLSALVAARDDEDRLSEEEMFLLAERLLVAGHESTATQISDSVYALLTHPDQLALLLADLDLVPRAVEELMRYVPLLDPGNPRYALEDVELGGVTVRAGEPVIADLSSANHDESVYTNPAELDLLRQEASHLALGHGPHYCAGAPLARMELQVALRTLLTRLPGLRLAEPEENIVWKSGVATRGPVHLPITWDQS